MISFTLINLCLKINLPLHLLFLILLLTQLVSYLHLAFMTFLPLAHSVISLFTHSSSFPSLTVSLFQSITHISNYLYCPVVIPAQLLINFFTYILHHLMTHSFSPPSLHSFTNPEQVDVVVKV